MAKVIIDTSYKPDMRGWKTYLAGAGLMILGIAGALIGMFDWPTGFAVFGGGLGYIGLGHKVEKIFNFINSALENANIEIVQKEPDERIPVVPEAQVSAGAISEANQRIDTEPGNN